MPTYDDVSGDLEVDEDLFVPESKWEGTRGLRPSYGRLYAHSGDELERSGPVDGQVLLGRSGTSGYRGGRPTFGAGDLPETEISMGPLQYRGPQLGGIVLGLAAALLAWRALNR